MNRICRHFIIMQALPFKLVFAKFILFFSVPKLKERAAQQKMIPMLVQNVMQLNLEF